MWPFFICRIIKNNVGNIIGGMTMKRRSLMAAFLVGALLLGGCSKKGDDKEQQTENTTEIVTEEVQTTAATTTEQKEINYEDVYSDVLHSTYDFLLADIETIGDVSDEQTGLFEEKLAWEPEETLKNIGYAFRDISGDGIPELLIAENASGGILAIYTVEDETPVFVRSGHSRDCLYLLKGSDTIYNYGASGAAYVSFGTFHLSENGQAVQWDDFYFTDFSDDNINYYHNTTGEWDTTNSEKLEVSADDFWAYDVSEDSIKRDLDLTLFIYMPGGSVEPPSTTADGVEIVDATGTGVDVRLANYESGELLNCKFLDLSSTEYRSELGFFAIDGNVVDLTFYKIECVISDEGEIAYKGNSSYAYVPYIKEDEPLLVYLEIPGDMPTTGFSYVDASGNTSYYAISLSGYDGSVVLTPYTPID